MSLVVLGNRHAHQSLDNGQTFEALPKGKRATTIEIPEDYTLAQAFLAITDAGGVWASHVHQVKGETPPPAWVASDDPALATLIAGHYGGIEIRDLEEN
ncbi:MAG TPA: hypothetical protein VGE38_06880 [Nocardioides sp.]|uniref:hypothetical protein n=1 Tax=Nocardioides sp. TaxID=35761 RepID=UPI002ED8EB5C